MALQGLALIALQAIMKGLEKGTASQKAFMNLNPTGVGQQGMGQGEMQPMGGDMEPGMGQMNAGFDQSSIFGGSAEGGAGDILAGMAGGAAGAAAGGAGGMTLGDWSKGAGGAFGETLPEQGGGFFGQLARGATSGEGGQGFAQNLGALAVNNAKPLELPQAPDMGQGLQMQNLGGGGPLTASQQSAGPSPQLLAAMLRYFQ